MRENFKEILNEYNTHAKDTATKISKEERVFLQEEAGNLIEKSSKKRGNSAEVQAEILNIQKSKQNIMRKMHKQFRKLDNGGVIESLEKTRIVSFDKNSGKFYYSNSKDTIIFLDISDILTDGEWGITYGFDNSVPKSVQKKYILSEAKREIANKLDEQIILDESTSPTTDTFKQKAYLEIKKSKDNQDKFEGFLAEKMIKGLLAKLSIEGADFEIEEADVYQDVEQKIDFLIRRKNHNRAVGVTEDDKIIGVQFTLNKAKEDFKKKQVERSRRNLKGKSKRKHEREVDDIMLVVMPVEKLSSTYRKWAEDKKPGGPENLWDINMKYQILKGVLNGLVDEEEIRKLLYKDIKTDLELDLFAKQSELEYVKKELDRRENNQ
ncbi:hypothetical protein IPJ63_01105 [Candidatus Nomurabacteria bacterium]|nr:MAG: hypothetical protein IPJ63_01105 [Candidatus Nomurabacteria bacterium]